MRCVNSTRRVKQISDHCLISVLNAAALIYGFNTAVLRRYDMLTTARRQSSQFALFFNELRAGHSSLRWRIRLSF
jgi:hypothetical protein